MNRKQIYNAFIQAIAQHYNVPFRGAFRGRV